METKIKCPETVLFYFHELVLTFVSLAAHCYSLAFKAGLIAYDTII